MFLFLKELLKIINFYQSNLTRHVMDESILSQLIIGNQIIFNLITVSGRPQSLSCCVSTLGQHCIV